MSSTDLFRRIPEGLFGPLAGANRRLYWSVLCALYEGHFSWDDAPVDAAVDGAPRRAVAGTIERVLREQAIALEAEDGYDAAEPPAHYVFRRLAGSGWLTVERENLRDYVSMAPAVAQLLGALIKVSSDRPTYAGGKVQVIHNTLKQALADPRENVLGFAEVAESAREFARYMRSIVVRIRDIHDRLEEAATPRETLRSFFDEFVSEVLIADYRELKTSNHPFRFRTDIVRNARTALHDERKRLQFITGYQDAKKLGAEAAEEQFERDADALLRVFTQVEHYLERIDRMKLKLERRVANKVRYAERSALQVNDAVLECLAALKALPDEAVVTVPVVPTGPAGEANFSRAGRPRPKARPAPIRGHEVSPRQLALRDLRRAARRRRTPNQDALMRYVERHMGPVTRISSDALTIDSVEDYCAFLALTRIPLDPRHFRRKWPAFLKRFHVVGQPGAWTENDYLRARAVVITRSDRGAPRVA